MPDSATAPPAEDDPRHDTSVWRGILLALRGERHDYTSVRLERAVLLLAVPMVLEMVMESIFSLADVFWVSRLGPQAIATVGLTESIMTLVYAVAIGMSFAAGAIVSRRIGEKSPARASQAAGQIILLGTAAAAIIGGMFAINAAALLRFMGAEADVIREGTSYAAIMFGGNVTVFLIFLINAIFRGAGDAALAMRTLILANGINLVLDPCLIFGWGPFPELGLPGAAIATNVGRGIGIIYQLTHLVRGNDHLKLRWADLRPRPDSCVTILRTSGNGIAQLMISMTSWLGLFKILAVFGSGAVASYTIAMRIMIFALMPAWGLSNAGSTLVGQNLGAGKPERAERAVRIAMRYNVIFLGTVGLLFIVFARPIIAQFTTDADVFALGVRALWIISLGFPIYAAGMCLEGTFNGAGDTRTPTRLNFFTQWLFQVPLAWLLAHVGGLGPTGVFIAAPVSFAALTLWSWILFRRGAWKMKLL
ncbi:MATE family efflux transporter [Synoicihabitans lomoniglobus]|uniref:Multidrug-efflux transporter n=1 Tax=Synoicihabitans lomoniglobus TaxID=2909285 RepID=A0AAF0CP68_9BACT|nr:MATE family efflux transporter [Opitutaceae bacterium LMO-M01]WED63469.1 MATE family efflux transporter [Opitutaceae bacterium LMO-M01]